MLKRRAIVIECSEIPNENKIPGAKKDLFNWCKFLISDLGGAWKLEEIDLLDSSSGIQDIENAVKNCESEYLFIAFSGHGYRKNGVDRICLYNEDMSVAYLKQIVCNASSRATLVLDCCRGGDDAIVDVSELRTSRGPVRRIQGDARPDIVPCRTGIPIMESFSSNEGSLNQYARIWLNAMNKMPEGLVTMWACSKGEAAGEYSSPNTNAGGYFTTALINAAMVWNRNMQKIWGKIYMTDKAFADAVKQMYNTQQNPQYEPNNLTFPFAVSTDY